jgi:light-regulated signal transduction histidine kinase (bacteriophytochrome)
MALAVGGKIAYPLSMSGWKLAGGGKSHDREISEFLLRACHDLRTSLRAVRAHSELLLQHSDAPAPSGLQERLRFVVDGATRIDLLVEGVASYAVALQIDAGSFQSTRMDVLLRGVLARLDKEIRDNHAEITYDPLPRVSGNPDRLMQVLEHLLRNALRHRGPSAPRIHISAEKQAERWLFAVKDNGPGLEADCLESVFKPFERCGKESTGPGLGLAICRVIVERHGGAIWAESNAVSGSTFLFTLPVD